MMEKLVRDLIPEIMKRRGQKATFYIAEEEEFLKLLGEKLIEEVHEFIQNPSKEEMADILEVLETFKEIKKYSSQEIENTRLEKKKSTGGFHNKVILKNKE